MRFAFRRWRRLLRCGLLRLRLVEASDPISIVMILVDIADERDSRKNNTSSAIGNVCGHEADHLNRVSPLGKSWPSANAIYGNSVHEVGFLTIKVSTDVPVEEAKVCTLNSWIAKPSNIISRLEVVVPSEKSGVVLRYLQIPAIEYDGSSIFS